VSSGFDTPGGGVDLKGGMELSINLGTWTPPFRKQQLARKGFTVVTACAESQSTSRGPNRTRFLAAQATRRVKMQCEKKSVLAEADVSKKRNLMSNISNPRFEYRRKNRAAVTEESTVGLR
jgi:hypothetical protein